MFRGFGRALEGGSGEGIQSGRNRFFEGLGGGSWEGKNQRNPMKGSLILSLRVGAGKGVWSGRGARKACPGHSFVKISPPQRPHPKRRLMDASQGRPKVARGMGVGGGRDRGRRSQEGHGGHRKRCGRVRMAIKVCPGFGFVRFAARCLISRASSRTLRGSQKVARTIGKARI